VARHWKKITEEDLKGLSIRQKAEAILNDSYDIDDVMQDADLPRILHELRVHQIELELQNEELRRAQVKIRSTQQRYYDLSNFAPIGYLTLDQEGVIHEINARGAELFGREYQFIRQHPLLTFIAPSHHELFLDHLDQVIKHQKRDVCELELRRRGDENSPIFLQFISEPVVSEGADICWTAVTNITERKRTQKKLQDAERRYRLLSDATHDWVYWRKPDGAFHYISPNCKVFTGYDANEFRINENLIDEIVYPDDRDLWDTHVMLSEQHRLDVQETQFRIVRASGEVRWVNHFCAPIYNDDGSYMGRRVTNQDITERKIAQQHEHALQMERERSDILRHFVRDISHEFRTPMSIINTGVEMMMRYSPSTASQDRAAFYQEQVMDSVADMASLLEDMLKMVELDSINSIPFDSVNLHNSVSNALVYVQPVATEFQQDIQLDMADDIRYVKGHEGYIERAMVELLDNALRYSAPKPLVYLKLTQDEEKLIIEVRDEGDGIPPKELEQVFQRLYRIDSARTERRSGLGLSMVQAIARLHGGDVTLESTVGVGTTATLIIPHRPF